MKILLIVAATLMSVTLNAQKKDTSAKSTTTITVQHAQEVVEGNKIINNYKLIKPNITVINMTPKRALILVADTAFQQGSVIVTKFLLSEIDGRQLEKPSFSMRFDSPIDTAYAGIKLSITGGSTGGSYPSFSADKKEFYFKVDVLDTNAKLIVTVVSKKKLKGTLYL